MEFVIRFFCQNEEESKQLEKAEQALNAAGIRFDIGSFEGCREWFFDKSIEGNVEILALEDYEPPELKPYDEI
jgi:hypothetical protein